MLSSVRAGLAAALIALALAPALAADKAFQRKDLDEAAIKLEAQIKSDAGTVTKNAATLQREADAAFQSKRFPHRHAGARARWSPRRRTTPASWLRLARTIRQIRPRDERERALLLDRASTAAYIAYQRAQHPQSTKPTVWRCSAARSPTASNGARRSTPCGWRSTCARPPTCAAEYERLRVEHGFRMLDYSVDSDAVSPRACFQFSEDLPGRRTDFSPFVAVAGHDKPAISANDKQLCVEGLKHGERYEVTLRAGLPSTVQ